MPNVPADGNEETHSRRHFIQQIIDADRQAGLHDGRVHTGFRRSRMDSCTSATRRRFA